MTRVTGAAAIERPPALTEEQFQQQVFDLARLCGWKVAHFRVARTQYGWRTPVSADGKGFPDTVLAKAGRPVIFAELKRKGNKPSPEQEAWLALLKVCLGVQSYIWYPKDFEKIVEILR